jgi:heat shock protein HspQ
LRPNVEVCAYSARLLDVLIEITDLEGGARPGLYFDIGTVVRHALYGYRGVIVAYDFQCVAGDNWYLANKTQPSRQQPWYHMLVHDSGGLSTYVAQSNLEAEIGGKGVNHPRIECYFGGFENGAYLLKLN